MPVSFAWSLTTREASTPPGVLTGERLSGQVTERDLKLDRVTGDLELVNGDFPMVAGIEAVSSDLRARLNTWLGEWELDVTLGTDWQGQILGKAGRRTGEAELRARILETPGVTGFESFAFSISGRTLSVVFRVTTDLGQVIAATLGVNQGAQ
jgi:hypothetical protein